MGFFLYMLRCSDGSYYLGHTDDLDRRLMKHGESVAGYVSTRRPFELVYLCEFENRDQALWRERQIKGWSRKKKEALIREDWAGLHAIVRAQRHPPRSS